LLSAPHYARLSKEKEAQKIPRPPLQPKKTHVKGPESALYSPLEEKSQIRLLSIQRGSDTEDLRCDLEVVSLDDNPAYCTLSYTWGEPIKRANQALWTLSGLYQVLRELYRRLFQPPAMILVNNQPFKITDNLRSALVQLQSEEHTLPIWVDQICINQDDREEKASQVGLMTAIYDQSQRTYIWLGPSADDSDAAMDFIRSVHANNTLLRPRDPDRDNNVPVPWPALQALFARSWWERIWVVQEMFLSKEATVKCGSRSVDLDAFVSLATALDDEDATPTSRLLHLRGSDSDAADRQRHALMPPGHPFRGLLRLWGQRRAIESGHRMMWLADMVFSAAVRRDPNAPSLEQQWKMPELNLWQWVYQTQQFQSTMRRDRIFALLGLARKEDREGVTVVYPGEGDDAAAVEKGDCEVFAEAAACMVRSGRGMDVIQLSSPGKKSLAGLPSWVPDFSTGLRGAMDMLLLDYRAGGGPQAWAGLTPEDVVEE
jgi:hypothetical protein